MVKVTSSEHPACFERSGEQLSVWLHESFATSQSSSQLA